MARVGPINAPLIPTMILISGGYMMWFAVHYWRDVKQVYPTDPVKSVLTGKGVPAAAREGTPQDPNAQTGGFAELGTLLEQGAQDVTGGASTTNPGSTPAGVFSSADMVSFWAACGGDPARAQFAAGVMMAESSGNPKITSSNPDGGTNVGLFQLDTRGVGAGHTVAELQDPTKNTQITIMATRNGTDWVDWADPFVDAHGTKGNL